MQRVSLLPSAVEHVRSVADPKTVLTKVGVYAGIGFLVVWGSPYVFHHVETGLGL